MNVPVIKHFRLLSQSTACTQPRLLTPDICGLQNEQDLSTRRNAFQFLTQHNQQRAINYLLGQVLPGSQLCCNPCSLCWHRQGGALHAVQAVRC